MGEKVHVLKLPRGHARIELRKGDNDTFSVFFCFAKEFLEPGTEAPREEETFPIIGVELWGKENAEIIGRAFLKAAETIDRYEKERGKT